MPCTTHHHACECREAAFRRVVDALEYEALCPCCTRTDKCEAECTYASDAPSDCERMKYYRALLESLK